MNARGLYFAGQGAPALRKTPLPRLAVAWLVSFLVLQIWHAAVVLGLPETAPAGRWAWASAPFHAYMRVHAAYEGSGGRFLLTTTLLDIVEVAFTAGGLLVLARSPWGLGLVALGQAMYASKIVVVVALELAGGRPYTRHAATFSFVAAYLLPQAAMGAASVLAAAACMRTGFPAAEWQPRRRAV